LQGITRSPVLDGYRNNAEFTVGRGPCGHPAVGFLYGRYADGFMAIADPRRLRNVSKVAKGYADLLRAFLRSGESTLPVWDKALGDVDVRTDCGILIVHVSSLGSLSNLWGGCLWFGHAGCARQEGAAAMCRVPGPEQAPPSRRSPAGGPAAPRARAALPMCACWRAERPAVSVQAVKRGFWRLLAVREGRAATHFPPPAPLVDTSQPLTFANLDTSAYHVPVAQGTSALHMALAAEDCGWHVAGAALPPAASAASGVGDTPNQSSNEAAAAEAPPPDDVVLLLQVNPAFTSKHAAEAELRVFVAYLDKHTPEGLPRPTVVAVQENSLGGNGAPAGARVYSAPGFVPTGGGPPAAPEKFTFRDTLCEVPFELAPTSFFQARLPLGKLDVSCQRHQPAPAIP
jgi:hypothetical protein